jgi:hypothetical protein
VNLRPLFEQARGSGARTCRDLAKYLNARAVPSRYGGVWHAASVARVLNRLRTSR